jgi:hypothetical protein
MAVDQLSKTLGYKGVVGASIMAGVVAGVAWLRRLPSRAPLLRYSILALLISAFITVATTFIISSTWAAYLALAAIGLTIIAAFLTVNFLVSCAILGGASTVGAGIAIITDGLALVPHVASRPTLEPLINSPEPTIILAAGVLTIVGGIALLAIRETIYVAPLMKVGVVIVVAGVATILVGLPSSAKMILIPAGLATGGFGTAAVSVAGFMAWMDKKTPRRAAVICAVCGVAIIAFDLGVRGDWETTLGNVSTIALGGAAIGLGIGKHFSWLGYLALALAGISIAGLGVTVLMHQHPVLGKASIETGVAIAALGITVLWYTAIIGIIGLLDGDGRVNKILRTLISDSASSLSTDPHR